MWMITLLVYEVAKVEVDVVEAIEGGANPKHQHGHMSTHNHLLPTNNCGRTKSWPDGKCGPGCSDV